MIRLWESFVANCPFLGEHECNWSPQLLRYLDPLLDHMLVDHKFQITHPLKIVPIAQEYISELSNLNFPLDPTADLEIISRLMQQKIDQMCKRQQEERSLAFSRKCLFCKEHINNRLLYFKHLKDIHGFNTGHPDNLVNISCFLDSCQEILDTTRCIFCKKYFPEATLLRKHMRKKKHFKINALDNDFDQFYIINYKEEDDVAEDNQEEEEGYSDWEEEVDKVTMCLFDGNFEAPAI